MSLFHKFLYVSTALLLLGSMYINFFLDDLIPKEFSEFKAQVKYQIIHDSRSFVQRSNGAEKEEEASKGTKNAKQKEESFEEAA